LLLSQSLFFFSSSCVFGVCLFLASWHFAWAAKAIHNDSEHRWCSHGRGFMQWGTMCLIVSPVWDVLIPGAATNRCLVRVDVPLKFLSCLSCGSASLCRCGDCSGMCLRGYSHVALPVCQRYMTGLSVCEWCSKARFS
jgi:hypothetical protein